MLFCTTPAAELLLLNLTVSKIRLCRDSEREQLLYPLRQTLKEWEEASKTWCIYRTLGLLILSSLKPPAAFNTLSSSCFKKPHTLTHTHIYPTETLLFTHSYIFQQLMASDLSLPPVVFVLSLIHTHTHSWLCQAATLPSVSQITSNEPVSRAKMAAAVSLAVEMWSVIRDGISIRAAVTSCEPVNWSGTQKGAETWKPRDDGGEPLHADVEAAGKETSRYLRVVGSNPDGDFVVLHLRQMDSNLPLKLGCIKVLSWAFLYSCPVKSCWISKKKMMNDEKFRLLWKDLWKKNH